MSDRATGLSARVLDEDWDEISEDNPLPIQDIDAENRQSLNTVFGEKITGRRVPSFAAQFQYGIAEDQADTILLNGGTATTDESLLKVNTGTNAAGSASIQTTDYLRYLPGHEAYIFFTGVFTQGVADSYQRAGLFDGENGFFIGYEGVDFCVARMRGSVIYKTVIDPSTIFDEEKDGIYDPTKGNVYRISFGYLGFATVNFEVMAPCGCWKRIHKIEYPNTSGLTHILQTNLPARAEVANTGNTSDIEFNAGSYEVGVVDGAGADASSRFFTANVGETAITAGDFEIITFRNKSTYKTIENRISAQLLLFSASTDVTKLPNFNIYVDSDLTNIPTWTDFDTDSVLEISTDATIDTSTGFSQLAWSMGKLDALFEMVDTLNVRLRPGQTATFVINTALGANGTTALSVRWKELF